MLAYAIKQSFPRGEFPLFQQPSRRTCPFDLRRSTEVADIQLQLTTHLSTSRDERLGWPGWLTYSGRFTHISYPYAVNIRQCTILVVSSRVHFVNRGFSTPGFFYRLRYSIRRRKILQTNTS